MRMNSLRSELGKLWSNSKELLAIIRMKFFTWLVSMICVLPTSSALADDTEYFQVKRIVQSMMASGSLTAADMRAYEPESRAGRNEIYLHGCSLDFNTDFDLTVFKYFYIAFQVELAKKILSEEGYPTSTWRDVLVSFEESALRRAGRTESPYDLLNMFDPVAQQLARELGASPRTGRFLSGQSGGECGDGGYTVTFLSEPQGARLWVLYEFDFLLCQAKGIDPWIIDRGSGCPWIETSVASDDMASKVYVDSGNYRYVAQWPDGHIVAGRRKLLASDYNADYGEDFVIIRR